MGGAIATADAVLLRIDAAILHTVIADLHTLTDVTCTAHLTAVCIIRTDDAGRIAVNVPEIT